MEPFLDLKSIKIRQNKFSGIKLPPDLIPTKKEEESFNPKFLAYYLLKYGDKVFDGIVKVGVLPPAVNAVLKLTSKGIKYLAKKYKI